MNLVRSLGVLATSIVVAGVVQAESASLYMKVRKSLPVALQRHPAVEQPVVQSGFRPLAELTMASSDQPTTQSAADITIQVTAQPGNKATVQSVNQAAAPEMQPIETILPEGTRVVAGDETKNEFYILTENQPDPVKHLPSAVVEKQLKRMDTPRLLWAFNQLPRVDVILSQIAHKVAGTEPVASKPSAVTTAAKPLPKAEKNGDIADIEFALDKTFAEANKQVAKPLNPSEKLSPQKNRIVVAAPVTAAVVKHQIKLTDNAPVADVKPVSIPVNGKPAVKVKSSHKAVKAKIVVDAKPQRKPAKNKVVIKTKPQHKVIKTDATVGIKSQHKVVKTHATASIKSQHKAIKANATASIKSQHKVNRGKLAVDTKPQHKPVKDKKVVDARPVKAKLAAGAKLTKAHHFWPVEKPSVPAVRKHTVAVVKPDHKPAHIAVKLTEHHPLSIANKKPVRMNASRRVSARANS